MTLPTITDLPTAPSSADPSTFNSRADAFVAALPKFQGELNALKAALPDVVVSYGLEGGMRAQSSSDTGRFYPGVAWDFPDAASAVAARSFGPFNYTPLNSGQASMEVVGESQPGILLIRAVGSQWSGGSVITSTSLLSGISARLRFDAIVAPSSMSSVRTVRVGLQNSITNTAPTDGLHFFIVNGSATPRSVNNSSSTNGTAVTVVGDTYYHFVIEVSDDGLSATFSVYTLTGELVGSRSTLTTNLPAAGRTMGAGVVAFCGSAETPTVTLAKVDFIGMSWRQTAARSRGAALDPITGTIAPWRGSVSRAAPNATVPAAYLEPATGTNVDAAVLALGTGALLAQIPDGLVAGGNKRGSYAVDMQRQRTAAADVASGEGSVIAGGHSNRVAGAYSASPGGRGGSDFGVSGSHVFGAASPIGSLRQDRTVILYGSTSGATPAALTSDGAAAGAANQAVIGYKGTGLSATVAVVDVIAVSASAAKEWTTRVLIRTNSAPTIIGTPTVTSAFGDAALSSCAVAVSADTTNDALAVTVTGLAGTAIQWAARVRFLDQLA